MTIHAGTSTGTCASTCTSTSTGTSTGTGISTSTSLETWPMIPKISQGFPQGTPRIFEGFLKAFPICLGINLSQIGDLRKYSSLGGVLRKYLPRY